MTEAGCRRKHKKTDRRRTPHDVRVAGTFAERPPAPRAPPRAPTPAENRANDRAMVEFAWEISDITPWLPVFEAELREMNRGKRGRPFEYPDSLVLWTLAYMECLGLSYRMAVGNLSAVLGAHGIAPPSHSRLCERLGELARDPAAGLPAGVLAARACGRADGRERSAGVDSTGICLSTAGLWRDEAWGREEGARGWLKLHALVDTDTGEILAYAVTERDVGDSPMLPALLGLALSAGHRIRTLFADGAYASVANYGAVAAEGIRFVTSFRSDTVPRNRGCAAWGDATRLWCALPYGDWVAASGYGTRWKCECVFSDLKRILGEAVTARKERSVAAQVAARVRVFNGYKRKRAEIMGVTGNGVAVA